MRLVGSAGASATEEQLGFMGFGPRLKADREAAGKSQRQLADEVGVDVATVRRLERGE